MNEFPPQRSIRVKARGVSDVIVADDVFVEGARRGQAIGSADPGSWRGPDAWSWIVLTQPHASELTQVQQATGLQAEWLEQARRRAIRPTAVAVGDAGIIGYPLAQYDPDGGRLELKDMVLAFGPDYVVVVTEDIEAVRELERNLAKANGALVRGPTAVFELSADVVVDSFLEVIEGLDVDIKRVERQVFTAEGANQVEQIYRLRRAVADLEELLTRLIEETTARFIRRRLPTWMAEVPEWFAEGTTPLSEHDQQFERMVIRVQGLRGLLDSILNASLVQVGIRQNVDMRKISAWVAIAATPTMFAGIYGMNFDHMPELSWRFGYPGLLFLMASICAVLYWRFRKNDWL
jgi:magnesium transporter